ncbi:MAG: hypothetical protein ACLFQX_11285 [Candidatus Kapaibacterium sp.]
MNPWNRQKGETARQYEAFCAFLDMGTSRSKTITAENMGISIRTIHNYAGKWDWNARAEAFDSYRIAKNRRQMEIFIEKNAENTAEIARMIAGNIQSFLQKIHEKIAAEQMDLSGKKLDDMLKLGQSMAKTLPELMKAVDALADMQIQSVESDGDKLGDAIRKDEIARDMSSDLLSRITEINTKG